MSPTKPVSVTVTKSTGLLVDPMSWEKVTGADGGVGEFSLSLLISLGPPSGITYN